MMKTINERIGKKDKVDRMFLSLFTKLDEMVKLQLIICPDSMFQRQESLFLFYSALKRMYEQLSHGNTFYDSEVIRRFQLCEDFKNFLDKKASNWINSLNANAVLQGDKDRWQDKTLISVN